MNKINIYQKLTKSRQLLNQINIKKSGKMKLGNNVYSYFELSDIMPHISKICDDIGLYIHFDFFDDRSELKIINCDNPEESVVFNHYHKNLENKETLVQKHLQGIGSKSTYMMRYLIIPAFLVSENDSTEILATIQKEKSQYKVPNQETQNYIDSIKDILNKRKIDNHKAYITEYYKEHLNSKNYKSIYEDLIK